LIIAQRIGDGGTHDLGGSSSLSGPLAFQRSPTTSSALVPAPSQLPHPTPHRPQAFGFDRIVVGDQIGGGVELASDRLVRALPEVGAVR